MTGVCGLSRPESTCTSSIILQHKTDTTLTGHNTTELRAGPPLLTRVGCAQVCKKIVTLYMRTGTVKLTTYYKHIISYKESSVFILKVTKHQL